MKDFLDALERCFKSRVMRRADQVRIAAVSPPPPGRAGNGNNLVVIQGNPDSTRISSTVGSGGRDGGATTPPQGLESRLLHVACHVNWHRGPTTSRTASLPFLTQAQVFSELSIFLSPPPGIILPSINTAISIDRNPRV